jgi:hypothetical protein
VCVCTAGRSIPSKVCQGELANSVTATHMCDIGWWSNVVEMARMNTSSYEGRSIRETTREFQFALLHVDGARNNDVVVHGCQRSGAELEWNIDVQMNTTGTVYGRLARWCEPTDRFSACYKLTYCALRETGPATRLVMQLFAQLHATSKQSPATSKLGTSRKFERTFHASGLTLFARASSWSDRRLSH